MYSESSTPVLAVQANPLQLEHKNGVIDLNVEEYIKDEMWHTIAIAVDETSIEVLIDCESVNYLRGPRKTLVNEVISGGQTLLGQRFTGDSFLVG